VAQFNQLISLFAAIQQMSHFLQESRLQLMRSMKQVCISLSTLSYLSSFPCTKLLSHPFEALNAMNALSHVVSCSVEVASVFKYVLVLFLEWLGCLFVRKIFTPQMRSRKLNLPHEQVGPPIQYISIVVLVVLYNFCRRRCCCGWMKAWIIARVEIAVSKI